MAEKKDPIRSLIDTGRRAGKLTSSEISDAMEENGNVLDVEAMEKLYEELLMSEETTVPTHHRSIMISKGREVSFENIESKLAELRGALQGTDEQAIRMLEEAVPTYRHTPNC